nr:MAG TPA: hypothetical protein [Caudoviricetes sp.]
MDYRESELPGSQPVCRDLFRSGRCRYFLRAGKSPGG